MLNSNNRTNCALQCKKVKALSHNKLHTVMTSRADFATAVLRNSYNSPKRRRGRTHVTTCSHISSLLSSFRALRIYSDFEITRRYATSAINDRLQKKDRRETEENKRKKIEFNRSSSSIWTWNTTSGQAYEAAKWQTIITCKTKKIIHKLVVTA